MHVRAFTSPPLLSILKKYISVFIETISFNIYYILLTFCKSHAHMFSHISLSTLTFVVYKYIRFTFWCFKYFFKSKIITNLYQYQCSMFTHTYIKAYYLYASFISTSSVDTVESPNAVFK